MQVKGIVHLIEQTQEIGEKGFKKRLLVVKTDAKFKNLVPIEFTQDAVDLLDDYSEGDEVIVEINVGGQEWKGKYFASINGWKIEKSNSAPAQKNTDKAPSVKKETPVAQAVVEDDGLPF